VLRWRDARIAFESSDPVVVWGQKLLREKYTGLCAVDSSGFHGSNSPIGPEMATSAHGDTAGETEMESKRESSCSIFNGF
jgi:hypothetical protein